MPSATGGEIVVAAGVDLTNCDREQIHIPGMIQPHGVMLVLRPHDLVILQASENTASAFGIDAQALTSRGLDVLLGPQPAADIAAAIERAGDRLDGGPLHLLASLAAPGGGPGFDVMVHRAGDLLILELERMSEDRPGNATPYPAVLSLADRLRGTPSLDAFFELAVTQVQALTGFDRVMAYRFAEDGSGEVVAEARRDGLVAYLGHHFPASDIPAPARRLFALSWLRHLPDVAYTPVRLVPAGDAPVDMSRALLRHVSVMYTGYLKNMRVQATLVMPLMKAGRLWGLMSCMHHDAPLHVPCETRTAVELLAHMVSLLMSEQEDRDTQAYRLRMSDAIASVERQMIANPDYQLGLHEAARSLHRWLDAPGAALAIQGSVLLTGETPAEHEVRALLGWLAGHMEGMAVFATDRLAELYPPAASFEARCAGLLAVRLIQGGFVIWFRPAVPTTVDWAGDPRKPVQVDVVDGEARLLPRTSFAVWREIMTHRSAAWLPCEIEAAENLRRVIGDVTLLRMNEELQRSNAELDSFAYAASHDLKEPMRGISNFANFLKASAESKLTGDEAGRIETILRLTQRMDGLTDALLEYARVGRSDFAVQPVSLADLLQQVVQGLQSRVVQFGVDVKIPRPLPMIESHPVWLTEVFSNLLSNAIKYNDHPPGERWIEITWRMMDGQLVISIRDNGIGIAPQHLEDIFRIFRRLHARDQYEGGNGAGLTIARRTVERMGGRLWAESEGLGQGSTFLVSLAGRPSGLEQG